MREPLIILSPPRSYTSVVCAMLGQHPEMYGLPEVNLFLAETIHEREGVIRQQQERWAQHGLLRVVAEVFGGEQTVQTVILARKWLEIRSNSTCVSVLRTLAEKLAPRILVDKSPRTIVATEYMQRARRGFPNARFIQLLRHPRPQGESLFKMTKGLGAARLDALDYSTDPPTVDYQRAWFTQTMNIVTFLDGVPAAQKLRVRGEDLMAAPEIYLRKIAEWLGLRTDDEAIKAMMHPERSPYACFGPVGARFGNDPNFLREPAFRPGGGGKSASLEGPLGWRTDGRGFTPEVKELARELGYE
jgi:hypothetical protein